MIWWIILAFIAGACMGVLIMALCAINDIIPPRKKWWEE